MQRCVRKAVNIRHIFVFVLGYQAKKKKVYFFIKSHKRSTIDHFLYVQKDDPVFVTQSLSIHISEEIMTSRKRIPVRNLLYQETDK